MVVTSWLSVGYHLVTSDVQVESRLWWVAGGSSHTFVAESPDECARAVMGVTPQSGLFSLLSSLFSLLPSILRFTPKKYQNYFWKNATKKSLWSHWRNSGSFCRTPVMRCRNSW